MGGPSPGEGGTRSESSICWVSPESKWRPREARQEEKDRPFPNARVQKVSQKRLRGVLSEARLPECILRHVCLLVCQVLSPSSSTQRTGGALSHRSEKQASPSLPESTRGHPQGPQGSLKWRSPHRRGDGGWFRNEPERWEEVW